MNKETLLFLQKVRESFPVFRKQEKRFFTDFSNSVKDYAVYNQKCTNKDLETRFGKPEDIVNTYYNNTDIDTYSLFKKTSRFVIQVTITLNILFMILFVADIYNNTHNNR